MRDRHLNLRQLANNQGGYFTIRQAVAVGFDPRNSAHYLSTGEWTRESQGIYHLAGVPSVNPAKDELHLWLLWTIGRKADVPRGALAYETALSVFELSDLIPSKIHLTVPRTFRVSKIPKQLVLHHEDRDSSCVTEHDGLRVVDPITTIIDLMRENRVSPEHIERAFKDGVRKGVITLTGVDKIDAKPAERRALNRWRKELL